MYAVLKFIYKNFFPVIFLMYYFDDLEVELDYKFVVCGRGEEGEGVCIGPLSLSVRTYLN